MAKLSSLIGGGGLSVPINGYLPLDSDEPLVTASSGEVFLRTGTTSTDVDLYPEAKVTGSRAVYTDNTVVNLPSSITRILKVQRVNGDYYVWGTGQENPYSGSDTNRFYGAMRVDGDTGNIVGSENLTNHGTESGRWSYSNPFFHSSSGYSIEGQLNSSTTRYQRYLTDSYRWHYMYNSDGTRVGGFDGTLSTDGSKLYAIDEHTDLISLNQPRSSSTSFNERISTINRYGDLRELTFLGFYGDYFYYMSYEYLFKKYAPNETNFKDAYLSSAPVEKSDRTVSGSASRSRGIIMSSGSRGSSDNLQVVSGGSGNFHIREVSFQDYIGDTQTKYDNYGSTSYGTHKPFYKRIA